MNSTRLIVHAAGMIRNSENQPRVWNFLMERGFGRGSGLSFLFSFRCGTRCFDVVVFAADVVVSSMEFLKWHERNHSVAQIQSRKKVPPQSTRHYVRNHSVPPPLCKK